MIDLIGEQGKRSVQANAVPLQEAPVPTNEEPILSMLGKLLDAQAAMLSTMKQMEKEIEKTQLFQQALQSAIESLSDSDTPGPAPHE